MAAFELASNNDGYLLIGCCYYELGIVVDTLYYNLI